MTQVYDVAIVGATPAGLTAALSLAKKDLKVIVIDAPRQSAECPLADWVGKDFFSAAELDDNIIDACDAEEFRPVIYHNATLDKETSYRSRTVAGYFVDPEKLDKALRKFCKDAGVKIRSSKTAPAISLEEQQVRIVGSVQTRAKLMLMAQNRPADAIGELSMPARGVPRSSLLISGVDIPVQKSDLPEDLPESLHIVETTERTEMGLFFTGCGVLHLRIISSSSASGNRAEELSTMVTNLQQAKILPEKLALNKARGAVWHPPAGGALEMESHVAKRCLIVGTAGGFSEAITGQTLPASTKSAIVAANVIADAIQKPEGEMQHALQNYEKQWRKVLANFIRPPSTSLQMLLPLLFVNKRLVSRFTSALLEGKNI